MVAFCNGHEYFISCHYIIQQKSENEVSPNKISRIPSHKHHWWLVRATYVVDGRFFGHFFWKVVGSCAHTR